MSVRVRTFIDRGIQRVAAGVVVFYLLNPLTLFAGRASDGRPWSTLLIALCYAVGLATIMRGWRTRLGVVDVATTLAALGAALILNDLWDTSGIGDVGGPASAALSVALLVQVVALRLRTCLVVSATTILLYAAARGIALGPSGAWDGLEESLMLAAFEIGFALAIDALRHAGLEAQTAAEKQSRAQAERVAAMAAQKADRESQRILHDDVIASLVAIDLARGAGNAEAIRAAAERAREAFDAPGQVASGPARRASADDHLAVNIRNIGDLTIPDSLPEDVVSAFTLASMEAIRNAERHAGVTEIEVHRRVTPLSLTVRLTDNGHGFRVDEVSGFGLTSGIVGRMREVGGTARIQSRPGHGTVVTLAWRRPTTPTSSTVPLPRVFPQLRMVAFGVLSLLAVLPLRHVWNHDHALVLAGVAVVSTVTTLVLTMLVRHRNARIFAIATLAVQLGLLAINIALVEEAALPDFDVWMIGYIDACLCAIAFALPVRLSLTCGAVASATLSLLVAWSPGISAVSPGAVLEPMLVGAGATALSASIRQANSAAIARRREEVASGQATVTAIATTRALRRRLAALRGSVLPFLEGVIDGSIDATDPETMAKARLLTLEARDELYLHEFLDDDLRWLLRQARLAGCEITIRSSEGAPASRNAVMLLRHSLDPAHTKHAVMVLPTGETGETRLRIRPCMTDDHAARVADALAEIGATVVSDPESTTVSVVS